MEINYSFIIPHKNCPDLLNRCLDSIPQREDIQIIVVDDNSDDGKKPSVNRKDVEVVLLDAEHSKGAGRARNVGLEKATGKWLLFADSDDYYTDDLKVLLEKYADDENTDIVYLNASIFDENGINRDCAINLLINYYIQGVPESELELRYNFWTPWSRMVKSEIIRACEIRFDEIPAGNDLMFGLKCSKFCKRMAVEENIVYMYYRPNQKKSQTDRMRNQRMLDARIKMISSMAVLYKEVGYPPIPSFMNVIFNSGYSKGMGYKEKLKVYMNTLSEYRVSFIIDLYRYLFRKAYFKNSKKIRLL